MPPLADARTASAAAAGWSVLGEYRVSPRPTSLANRSREPIVAAHPFNPSRLAVVYAAGPGEHSHPVIRISHDGGRTWRTAAGHPRGGGSHPMVAWGPGPRRARRASTTPRWAGPRRTTTSSVSYSDNEGRTWHLGFIANHTRGWSIGIEDLVVDTNPASPNYGAVYLAYNWPKDPTRGDGLHVVASGDYGRTFAETEIPKLPAPAGYRRRLAHRLQARDRAGRVGLRGGLPARHEALARVRARSPRAATRTSDGSPSGSPACASTARRAG